MKMRAHTRALDKIYKRRDRYEIPEWQRGEVWAIDRKQQLIDTILRQWKLPKFYFLAQAEEEYEVVDGQQRLTAIYEFFSNELPLKEESIKEFGGPLYKDLKPKFSDAFDDFEIEYDLIEDASEDDVKMFFQRLQQGLPLSSSEKLNSVHSKLRDFCRSQVKHDFFTNSVSIADTRFAHFDILVKTAVIEIEGIDTALRFEDLKGVFEAHKSFSSSSAVAKRIKEVLDFLRNAFPKKNSLLKNRTMLQSILTLTCRLIDTKKQKGLEREYAAFLAWFLEELSRQVELGQHATDYDFIEFQRSVSANVRGGAKSRHEILMRKLLTRPGKISEVFDGSTIAGSGLPSRLGSLSQQIAEIINQINSAYSASNGKDLFKATNRTATAFGKFGIPIKDLDGYKNLIDSLYFVFRESIGARLEGQLPTSFADVNLLRTDMQHDVDHGDEGKVRSKRSKISTAFQKYAGVNTPQVLEPVRFIVVQLKLLEALFADLNTLLTTVKS